MLIWGRLQYTQIDLQSEWAERMLELMAKDLRLQPTSSNSIPTSRPARIFGGGGRLSAVTDSFCVEQLAGRYAGIEFEDAGCVSISFAINSKSFAGDYGVVKSKTGW